MKKCICCSIKKEFFEFKKSNSKKVFSDVCICCLKKGANFRRSLKNKIKCKELNTNNSCDLKSYFSELTSTEVEKKALEECLLQELDFFKSDFLFSKETKKRIVYISKYTHIPRTHSIILNIIKDIKTNAEQEILNLFFPTAFEIYSIIIDCNTKVIGVLESLFSTLNERTLFLISQNNDKRKSKIRKQATESAKRQMKKRRKTDLVFKLKCNLRGRISSIMNRYIKKRKTPAKAGSAVTDLGCSIPQFIIHIESLFRPGMNWDNYGNKSGQWSIDHKIPLSCVDLTDRNLFLMVCHYTNLQPLWHLDNLKKGNKIV